MVQHSMKVGRGDPVDVQLSSYLLDADLFITNDKRLVRILDAVRSAARRTFAVPKYADIHRAQDDAVSAIESVLTAA